MQVEAHEADLLGPPCINRCRCVYLEQGLLSCWSSPSPASSKVSWELETKRFPISLKRRGNTWIHAKTKNKSKKLKNQSEAARTPPVVFPPPDCCTFSSSPLFPNIPALLLLPSCPCFMPKQTREKLQLTPQLRFPFPKLPATTVFPDLAVFHGFPVALGLLFGPHAS